MYKTILICIQEEMKNRFFSLNFADEILCIIKTLKTSLQILLKNYFYIVKDYQLFFFSCSDTKLTYIIQYKYIDI